MREGDSLPTVERSVSQERIERYAEAAGDFNPIHLDHDFAASTDFGGTIAHGMMVIAFISEMMTQTFSERWMATGRLKLRLRAPTYPGDTLTTYGRVKSVQERVENTLVNCEVGVKRQNGVEVIIGDASVVV